MSAQRRVAKHPIDEMVGQEVGLSPWIEIEGEERPALQAQWLGYLQLAE